MTTLQIESTEYLYVGLSGDVPSDGVEIAFMASGARPTSGDWTTATVVTSDSDPLWSDAVSSGASGDYYAARLVGSYGGNDVTLDAGDYQVWIRATDTTEQPVRIAPQSLEVEG